MLLIRSTDKKQPILFLDSNIYLISHGQLRMPIQSTIISTFSKITLCKKKLNINLLNLLIYLIYFKIKLFALNLLDINIVFEFGKCMTLKS